MINLYVGIRSQQRREYYAMYAVSRGESDQRRGGGAGGSPSWFMHLSITPILLIQSGGHPSPGPFFSKRAEAKFVPLQIPSHGTACAKASFVRFVRFVLIIWKCFFQTAQLAKKQTTVVMIFLLGVTILVSELPSLHHPHHHHGLSSRYSSICLQSTTGHETRPRGWELPRSDFKSLWGRSKIGAQPMLM